MKKMLVAVLLLCLIILIVVVVILVLIAGKQQGGSKSTAVPTQYSAAPTEATEAPERSTAIVAYAKEQWPDYRITYDPMSDTLTLSKETAMEYDFACAHGGSVYEGEAAPETYLQTVQIIAIDVGTRCGDPDLSVTLCYLSSDGKPIFTVGSDESIWTCWETEEP